jgi:signal transduction histidine kinase
VTTQSRRRLQRAADVAIPVIVGLFLVSLMESQTQLAAPLRVLGMVVGAAQGAALWWRREYPVQVMLVALGGGLVIQLLAPEALFPYAGLIAIGSLAAARPPRVSLPALVALLGLTSLNYATADPADATFAMPFPVVAWALGESVRNRRKAIREESRRAVSEEQARIARELHDVIAHSVSVIVVQAAAADDVFDDRPEQARTALRSIEAAGREALAELRRLIAAVRPGESTESVHPQPGLDRLSDLTRQLGSAGLDVSIRREGAPASAPLSAGVDLSAYRIVQEALTNTLRHAGASRAEVTIRADGGLLDVAIVDDGHGGSAATGGGSGHGIIGMRERATMLGGTLDAGPTPEGGFRVHARLPLEASP